MRRTMDSTSIQMPITSIVDATQGTKVAGGYIIKSPISKGYMKVFPGLNQFIDTATGRWGGVLELAQLLWRVTEDEAARRLRLMKEEQRHEPQPTISNPSASPAEGESLNQWTGGVEEGTGFFYFHKWDDGSHISGYRRGGTNHYEVWDEINQRWGAADIDASTPPDDVARAVHEEIEEETKKAVATATALTGASHDADGGKSFIKNSF